MEPENYIVFVLHPGDFQLQGVEPQMQSIQRGISD